MDFVRELAGPDRADPADAVLVSRARAGDERALEQLCRRCWRLVYRSFARYTSDPAEAEDLTQEVLLRAIKALPRFADQGAPFSAYVLRIAANLASDRWRAGPARAVPVGELPDRADPEPGPDCLAVRTDQRAALIRALDQLRPDQRAVLRLRILEGRSTAEVAVLTNRSPAAVRQLQVRALTALRVALAGQPGGLTADLRRD